MGVQETMTYLSHLRIDPAINRVIWIKCKIMGMTVNFDRMTAEQILAITSPEALFTKDNLEKSYKTLAKKWHPDINHSTLCNDVFMHIAAMYGKAIKKKNENAWGFEGCLSLQDKVGITYNIKYHYSCPFELGVMYVGDTTVTYLISERYSKLALNFYNQVRSLKFPVEDKGRLAKCVPDIKRKFATDDGNIAIVLNKTKDVFPLSVALNYLGGKIEPKSAAWILSTLHNMLCALKYNKLTHNGLDTSTYFISGEHHSGLLLGGWWYAVPSGSKLLGVPEKSFNLMLPSQKDSKKATSKLDAELLRAIGREILGDSSGFKLKAMGVPEVIANWVNIPSNNHAYDDYQKWGAVLTTAFGSRKFIPMEIDVKKAYEIMPRRK